MLLSQLGMAQAGEVQRYAQAVVDRSSWSIVAEGELNTVAYGGVLKAKQPVMVRGVGQQFSGRYYVERVLHTIAGDGLHAAVHPAPQRHRADRAGELPGATMRSPREPRRPSGGAPMIATPTAGRRDRRHGTARHYGKYRGTVTDNQDPRNQGRSRSRCPEILGDVDSGWALPCAPYAGDKTGVYTVPPVGAGVWVEFEAGDVSRPIWVGCWWGSDKLPTDEGGTEATPDVKIMRSEQGLLLALHDDSQTIALSDSNGANILKIEVAAGQRHAQGDDQGRRRRAADRAGRQRHASRRLRRQPDDLPQPARARCSTRTCTRARWRARSR